MSPDVIDLITQDHREVERLFNELQNHPENRPNLVPVLTALLTAHSRAEEAEVYPVARQEAGEAEEIAHAQQEHAHADQLLQRLAAEDPQSPSFERVLRELTEAVNSHVQEEEKVVLPGMRERLGEQRRADLGEAFAESRSRHLGEQPGEMTREDLQAQARNLGVAGASGMSKEELERQMKQS